MFCHLFKSSQHLQTVQHLKRKTLITCLLKISLCRAALLSSSSSMLLQWARWQQNSTVQGGSWWAVLFAVCICSRDKGKTGLAPQNKGITDYSALQPQLGSFLLLQNQAVSPISSCCLQGSTWLFHTQIPENSEPMMVLPKFCMVLSSQSLDGRDGGRRNEPDSFCPWHRLLGPAT